MTPNIFRIATKELHQDAFLSWLIQWAEPSLRNENKELNDCATEFVLDLLRPSITVDSYQISTVESARQWDGIDVWALINEEFLIIIEDKTFTSEHSDQLNRYKDIASKECIEKGYKLVCIYLKVGAEPLYTLKEIERKGFVIYDRARFLVLLDSHSGVKNNIFVDFVEYLHEIDKAYLSYESKIIEQWDGNSWVGLYQYLEKYIEELEWFWVSNPSGGFWGAIVQRKYWRGFLVYMQIEQKKICFKISFFTDDLDTDVPFDPNVIQDELSFFLLQEALIETTDIKKSSPFVHRGTYRTVAVIDHEKWLCEENGKLNKEITLKAIKKYRDIFNHIFK